MSTRIALALGAVFMLVALLPGCSSGNDGTGSPSPTSPPSTKIPTPPLDFGRDPVVAEADPSGEDVGTLVDVRSARHADFDRFVFEFRDALPGYRVEYASAPLVYCGSGRSVDVTGDAVLQVRFASTAASVIETRRLVLQFAALREAIITCDFEGDVTWLLGLNAETDFAVTHLDQPLRVVIDIAHP